MSTQEDSEAIGAGPRTQAQESENDVTLRIPATDLGNQLELLISNLQEDVHSRGRLGQTLDNMYDLLVRTNFHPDYLLMLALTRTVVQLRQCLTMPSLSEERRRKALHCLGPVARRNLQQVDAHLVRALVDVLPQPHITHTAAWVIKGLADVLPVEVKELFHKFDIRKSILAAALDFPPGENLNDFNLMVGELFAHRNKAELLSTHESRSTERAFFHNVLWLLSMALEEEELDDLPSTVETWMPTISQALFDSVQGDTDPGGMACRALRLFFDSHHPPSPDNIVLAGLAPHIVKLLRSQSQMTQIQALKCIATTARHWVVNREFIKQGAIVEVGRLLDGGETLLAGAIVALQQMVKGAYKNDRHERMPDHMVQTLLKYTNQSVDKDIRFNACIILLRVRDPLPKTTFEEIVDYLVSRHTRVDTEKELLALETEASLAFSKAQKYQDFAEFMGPLRRVIVHEGVA